MFKTDYKVSINSFLWEKALEKLKSDFKMNLTQTDAMMIILLLNLYKCKSEIRSSDNRYLALEHPSELCEQAYEKKTISIYSKLIAELKLVHPNSTIDQIVDEALANFIVTEISFYTDEISPLYTIVGSKNHTMQKVTARAVNDMKLDTESTTLIDACCATGALYFGLKTYNWKEVILNDLNSLRTNFLNVIKNKPIKLIAKLLETDFSFISTPETKNPVLQEYKSSLYDYEQKRTRYHKVDCNVDIAYKMFIVQCIDKKHIESEHEIMKRIARFLPAHLKLQNAIITQEDALTYLKSETTDKLVLLDVPYIASESTCGIVDYDHDKFHKKVAQHLHEAKIPFLYYCRSTPPKSNFKLSGEDAIKIMKMKLGRYFFDKGFFFEKVHLANDTELLISNRHYSTEQFTWDDFEMDLT